MRPDEPGHEVHVVGLDELVRLLLARLGLEAVVFVDDLDVEAGHLRADVFDREVGRILHVAADHPRPGGEGGDEADLHLVRSVRRGQGAGKEGGGEAEGGGGRATPRGVAHVTGSFGRRPGGAAVSLNPATMIEQRTGKRGSRGPCIRGAASRLHGVGPGHTIHTSAPPKERASERTTTGRSLEDRLSG